MSAALDWYGQVATSRADLQQPARRRGQAADASSTGREVLPVFYQRADVKGRWWSEFERRVNELAALPPDWDSYGGSALRIEQVQQMTDLLGELDGYIQSVPSISLTGEGGLTCSWRRAEFHLELTTAPDAEPRVYFWNENLDQEWDGPAVRCTQLVKWSWQASAAY